jgi:tRNA-2-methylthio-N6-dimethylallyladenosine synthase
MEGLSFYIETFGCQMNEQDSLRAGERLVAAGCRQVSSTKEADILIVNTCSIRRKAEEKAYSLLGRFRALKRKKPGLIVAVGGCVAQQEGASLLDRMPQVDLVFGPHHVSAIDQLVSRCRDGAERLSAVTQVTDSVQDLECPGIPDRAGLKAYMTIMEGCDHFCSYCVVPFVRGRERSRPYRSLREEARRLAENGVRELTLLGQNVNAYRAPDRKGFRFPDLLEALSCIPGLRRLRFTTSHPKDLSAELIGCFGRLPPVCEHIHLPLQSGSDAVLAAMNRGYTRADYLEKISALRERVPQMAVTSDMIVGFPGEREVDFDETLEVIRRVRFEALYSFVFSPRPQTRAAAMQETVQEVGKLHRLHALQDLQKRISLEKNRDLEGTTLEVFVEGKSRDGAQWMGRTRTNKIVNFSGPQGLMGQFVDVEIRRGCQNSLQGALLPTREPGEGPLRGGCDVRELGRV